MFQSKPTAHMVAVWDLPVRLFHWSLVALMVAAWVTHKLDRMELHALTGYAILTLVLFRLAWGLLGSGHARFADFLRGPAATIGYARALLVRQAPLILGHNPLGGWMVLALLLALLAQGGLGLFGTDDVAFDGPLYHLVGSHTAALLTTLHKIGSKLLLGMVGLHLAGVAAHWLLERDNLVRPMITGRKTLRPGETAFDAPARPLLLAALLLAAAAGVVWAVVTRL